MTSPSGCFVKLDVYEAGDTLPAWRALHNRAESVKKSSQAAKLFFNGSLQ
jgi:hypothetical protein